MAPVKDLSAHSPTRSIPQIATKVFARQAATTTIVTTGSESVDSNNLSGGAIAGIVIGSIAGLLLLIWIIRSCSNLGKTDQWGNTFGEKDPPPRSGPPPTYYRQEASRSRHHSRGRRSRSRHSHYDRSPRRSVEVRPVYVQEPVAPPQAYYARDARRSSRRSSRNYYV